MDINVISDIINTFGFPAVMVAYFIYDRSKTIMPMINAINNNTTVIAALCNKIDNFTHEKKMRTNNV